MVNMLLAIERWVHDLGMSLTFTGHPTDAGQALTHETFRFLPIAS